MAKRKDRYEGIERILKKQNRVGREKPKTAAGNGPYEPNTMIYDIISRIYGCDDRKKADFLMQFIVKGLSLLATGGKEDLLFGKDFNEFFSLYVKTLNLCGRMQAALEENGIDFDVNGDDAEN